MIRALLVALLVVLSAPAASADEDDERARRLSPAALQGVLDGYTAYGRGDHAAAVAAWAPVAEVAPHRVQYLFGRLLTDGTGVAADPAAAAAVLAEAAAHGHPEGEFRYGLALLAANQAAGAVAPLAAAAGKGEAEAAFVLGDLYDSGAAGVAADPASAARWYREAADAGHARAMNNLGLLYADGFLADPGGEAARWIGAAARAGLADGLVNLGALYERGAGGLEVDDAAAYVLYGLAAAAGDLAGAERQGAVAARLSPGELAAADARIAAGEVP